MSITFKVIDTVCEAADQSFFPPVITMHTKSTTSVATVYGYTEFVPSNPPKRYHSITWSGISERVGTTGEPVPRQCAGAKYLFGGTGTINVSGVQVSNYHKNFYAQCPKQFWPLEPLQINPKSVTTGGDPASFVGFCWPEEPKSCPVCDPNDGNWPFLGNVATNNPQLDTKTFLTSGGGVVQTPTSFSINDVFSGQTEIDPQLNFPQATLPTGAPPPDDFVVAAYILWTDTSVYSATLSQESTDAEALANAEITIGTGATAQNSIRTTGLPPLVGKVTTTTNVIFTLLCTNLIDGKDYLVTVDFWDMDQSSSNNTHTTQSYGFTAVGTTHSITDIVPTPALNHIITVQKPTIAFA